jgi:uncharacterized NAD(P)/FAD-binding protein YdhS
MPHGPKQAETAADFGRDPAPTALALLRRVRRALDADATAGLTWHAVFDRLRAQGPAIWAALPMPERRRFLRHLRSLWDVHRFRVAPQTLLANRQMQQSGRLTHLAARIAGVAIAGQITLALTERQGQLPRSLVVDRVILATGPAHGGIIAATPALTDLATLGLLQADPLGLGLHTLPGGQAAPAAGDADGTLLIAGPLARGTVGELMGVPEVIGWSEHIARAAARQVRLHRSRLAAE